MREPYLRRGACLWDIGMHLLKVYRRELARFAADSPAAIQEWILARILYYSLGLPIRIQYNRIVTHRPRLEWNAYTAVRGRKNHYLKMRTIRDLLDVLRFQLRLYFFRLATPLCLCGRC